MKTRTHGNRIRVLHILEATAGGTMRYIENIIDATDPDMMETGFVYSTQGADHRLEPALAIARKAGWSCFHIEMARTLDPLRHLIAIIKLRNLIARFRPDIVHCHSSMAGAFGRLAAHLVFSSPRPRTVYSPHALAAKLGRHFYWIERVLARLTNSFIAVSDSERSDLAAYGLASHQDIGVVYPVVDSQYYEPQSRDSARRTLGIDPNAKLVVAVGRLTYQKNPLAFLEIIHKLSRRIPDILGIWVGSGQLEEPFLARAAELGLSGKIRVSGWIPDVRTHLAAANVLVSTSRFESFGYMVAEALASERPVVASAVTGSIDILRDNLSSMLYSPGDLQTAADKVEELLQNPEIANSLAETGRRSVCNSPFDLNSMRAALRVCYHSVLSAEETAPAVISSNVQSTSSLRIPRTF